MHSGADLQSAAASVLGYDQVSMKGKAIKVAPVPEVATSKLKTLLEAVLPRADEEAEAGLQGKAGAGGVTHTLTQVGNLMAVRRALLPALARGDKGCGGRLRYGINWVSTSCHLGGTSIGTLVLSYINAECLLLASIAWNGVYCSHQPTKVGEGQWPLVFNTIAVTWHMQPVLQTVSLANSQSRRK